MHALPDSSDTPARPSVHLVSGELFAKCTVARKDKRFGGYNIRCRLGLWAVSAPTNEAAEREARHYWIQYYLDGEYAALLANVKDSAARPARKTLIL